MQYDDRVDVSDKKESRTLQYKNKKTIQSSANWQVYVLWILGDYKYGPSLVNCINLIAYNRLSIYSIKWMSRLPLVSRYPSGLPFFN